LAAIATQQHSKGDLIRLQEVTWGTAGQHRNTHTSRRVWCEQATIRTWAGHQDIDMYLLNAT
jgi:hypothetical protein